MGFNNGGVLEGRTIKENTGVLIEILKKQTNAKRRCHLGL
jgi:hypothetical protein